MMRTGLLLEASFTFQDPSFADSLEKLVSNAETSVQLRCRALG